MSTTTTTRTNDRTATLCLAFELGAGKWRLGFTTGIAQKPRERNGRGARYRRRAARDRAGPGAIWPGRRLPRGELLRGGPRRLLAAPFSHGARHREPRVDSASIEVNRRKRRAKTDRLDVGKLLNLLLRYEAGERKS